MVNLKRDTGGSREKSNTPKAKLKGKNKFEMRKQKSNVWGGEGVPVGVE